MTRRRKIKTGHRATSGPTGGKRRARFQTWRYSNGKAAPVTIRKIEPGKESA